jgi:hypothetical protein
MTFGFRDTKTLALETQTTSFLKIYSLLSFSIFSLIFSLILRKEKKKIPKKESL